MKKPIDVASAFLLSCGRVYLNRRSSSVSFGGMLQHPGGKLEPGETPVQGVTREIAEETGLWIEPSRFVLLGVNLVELGEGSCVRLHTFAADLHKAEVPRVTEAHKQGPWMLLDVDVAFRCPLGCTPAMPTALALLREFIERRRGNSAKTEVFRPRGIATSGSVKPSATADRHK